MTKVWCKPKNLESAEQSLWELLRSIEYQLAESKAIFNFSEDDELIAIMLLKDSYLTKYREYVLSQLNKCRTERAPVQ